MGVTIMIIIGGLIILGLISYAAYLWLQVSKQKQQQSDAKNRAISKRNTNIFDSVNTLCLAGIQGQCDLSEISIRVYCILDYVQGEQRIDVSKEYPALFELYDLVKDMARGDARQKLAKQDRMRQTLERQKAEARLNDEVVKNLQKLQEQIKPLSVSSTDSGTANS
ncbi:DUF2489 domain-containing protein [Vibrio sp. TH_r3]|uniref:DUF2489 domain-containing protein n=1 Tax=Vibrio sp. TH_r3 TaxID=3082084 RepID=UPI002954CF08|nr:DUF2489 domain-containing protein [Vibrio sp. TH_r3]MDV7104131.1 DUF2489 domain-containing protein [Vibrio sp. TH_r3]